jgi:hypothetical protein
MEEVRERKGGGGRALGQNWNWRRSPALAVRVDGKKARLPLASDTWITCVITCPLGTVTFVRSWAFVRPKRMAAAAAVDREKRMVILY